MKDGESQASGQPPSRSRWIVWPERVASADARLPDGFMAAGIACGIKHHGRRDLALIFSKEETTSAAAFTSSGLEGCPVRVTRERCDLGRLRAVVATAGTANVATGAEGLAVARAMQETAAAALRIPVQSVAIASTGAIGVQLPRGRVLAGIASAVNRLSPLAATDVAQAIRTSDRCVKQFTLLIRLRDGVVRLSAQAKGSGMIEPAFATMFCFLQTDARISKEGLDCHFRTSINQSFNRISVDGQLSTSDTAILIANGASRIDAEPGTPNGELFGAALVAATRSLALSIVRDGEGARRAGRIVVRGGSQVHAEAVARSVATSPLVKTALRKGEPGWAWVAQAAGAALRGQPGMPFEVAIEGTPTLRNDVALPHDGARLVAAVAQDEIEYVVTLPAGPGDAEVFFSDLGRDYARFDPPGASA
ncbi:MAG: bifunctional ornithine acetyltransferase/N-acetylglutamate synthase [Gaiellaceae bacterium]